MLRTFRCRIVLLMSLVVSCVAQNGLAAQSGPRRLVSPELLKHANLKILWENELPIKSTDSLGQLLILGERLYAISDRNLTISLNSENGNIIFSRVIAPAGVPITGLKLYGDGLMYAGGSQLLALDIESGTEEKTIDIGFGIVCPAARNGSNLYVSGDDNRLHVFSAKDRVRMFEVAVENNSMITSVLADDNIVVFGTAGGNVVGMAPDSPKRLWQFDAADAITGPVIRDGLSLFFASRDTNVYRVDMVGLPDRKQLVWKHQTDGVLEKAPRVTLEVVYQYIRGKGVTAIDRQTGSFMWSVPGGVDLLAEVDRRAYVITKDRKLVVMDNVKAGRLYSVNFASVSRHTANVADSKIYIGDERGRIACLQPVQ